MTSIVGSDGEVDIVNFIGNHECSKVKVLREVTGIRAVPNLPQQNLKTAV